MRGDDYFNSLKINNLNLTSYWQPQIISNAAHLKHELFMLFRGGGGLILLVGNKAKTTFTDLLAEHGANTIINCSCAHLKRHENVWECAGITTRTRNTRLQIKRMVINSKMTITRSKIGRWGGQRGADLGPHSI
jgi:hypothetical protein